MNRLRLATRASALAMWQARRVALLIRRHFPDLDVELVTVSTSPDRRPDLPLEALGGDKGLFVREVEEAIRSGAADAAVHSLKDVPVEEMPPGFCLAAMPERADPGDVLYTRNGLTLADLPPGSTVATSSQRRAAHILHRRPDLATVPVRGNVGTRLNKLAEGQFDALVLAAAGVGRLELRAPDERFSPEDWCPAAGQGIIAVEAPEESAFQLAWAAIDNRGVREAGMAERKLVRRLGAGCRSAAGAYALAEADGRTRMTGFAAMPDGSQYLLVRKVSDKPDLSALADEIADELLARGADLFPR